MAPQPFGVQLQCCICLHTYTDPTSIPCGHNFCLDCIEGYWDTKDISECPLCKEPFRERPELRINRELAELVLILKRAQSPNQRECPVDDPPEAGEVSCDICHRNKSTAVKSCLMCQTSYCELHLTAHRRDPALQTHQLTDPATFPSSHLCRKHNKPLTMLCKKDQMPVCVKCTDRDHKHHETVPMEESRKIKIHLKETKADVQQMIQVRRRKMEQIKKSVDLSKKITEREIQRSVQMCTLLVTAIEQQQAELVEELNKEQEQSERRAQELLDELEQEINELQTRSGELQHVELTQNPLHLLQSFLYLSKPPATREWSEVAVHPDNCMRTVRRAISKFAGICREMVDQLSAEEIDKMNQYAVDITLDPETASGWLVLSSDRKKVSLTSQKKTPLPDSPRRFDTCVCILGKQSFTSGRRYWEVEVRNKTDWDLGVARESVRRKGAISVRPDSGYWAICRRRGGNLSACTSPSASLHLQEIPQKVGVFLDYEEGSVSFYNAEAKTHIYTYSGLSFTEPLHPYFNPCVQENGRNTSPLIICPVSTSVREEQDITVQSHV